MSMRMGVDFEILLQLYEQSLHVEVCHMLIARQVIPSLADDMSLYEAADVPKIIDFLFTVDLMVIHGV